MRRISGDIHFVNLTNRTWWREPAPKNHLLAYLGGRGLNARLLWDYLKPGKDALGPDNVMIFGPGLLSVPPFQGGALDHYAILPKPAISK